MSHTGVKLNLCGKAGLRLDMANEQCNTVSKLGIKLPCWRKVLKFPYLIYKELKENTN